MNHLEIYIDGASKGNPGKSGIGIVIYRDNRLIKNISSYIGRATNNVADIFLHAETVTSATSAWGAMSQQFMMGNQTFNGIQKVTCTGCAASAILVITGIPE